MGAMTAASFSLGLDATTIDLRDPSVDLFGTSATRAVGSVRTLWSGNCLRDGQLKYTGAGNDRDPILGAVGGTIPTSTSIGYRQEDVNMDGVTKYAGPNNDRDPILQNIGGTVPTTVRMEQLP